MQVLLIFCLRAMLAFVSSYWTGITERNGVRKCRYFSSVCWIYNNLSSGSCVAEPCTDNWSGSKYMGLVWVLVHWWLVGKCLACKLVNQHCTSWWGHIRFHTALIPAQSGEGLCCTSIWYYSKKLAIRDKAIVDRLHPRPSVVLRDMSYI